MSTRNEIRYICPKCGCNHFGHFRGLITCSGECVFYFKPEDFWKYIFKIEIKQTGFESKEEYDEFLKEKDESK